MENNISPDIKQMKFKLIIEKTDKYLLETVLNNYYRNGNSERLTSNMLAMDRFSICVAGGYGKSENPYVKTIVETVFPVTYYNSQPIVFNCDDPSLEKVYEETGAAWNRGWRDDILWCRNHIECLDEVLRCFLTKPHISQGKVFPTCRIVFWNLFLTAIDDEIYAEELSNVLDLAYIMGLNEKIVRDLCNGVNYVLDGNHLRQGCDLSCKTDEGKCFLLHDYTNWTSCGAGYGLDAINNY